MPPTQHRHPLITRILGILFLAVIYNMTARLGLELGAIGGVAAPIWPPAGISLAVLLIFGLQLWPGIALGAFVANLWATDSPIAASGIAIGNTLEALTAVYFLNRLNFRASLERITDALLLVGIAAVGSTVISALIGVTSGWLNGSIGSAEYLKTWFIWWLGDLMGVLVFAPFLLVWSRRVPIVLRFGELIEASILTTFLITTTLVHFSGLASEDLKFYIRIHHLLPFLIWAAIRFGQRGSTAASFMIAILTTWGTTHGYGPFAGRSIVENLIALQSFLGIISLTLILFGAIVCERKRVFAETKKIADNLRTEREIRDKFVSTLTHDLRTPLAAAKMAADLIERQSENIKVVQSLSLKISNNITRADQMIQDLLDANRLRAGQSLTLDISEVNLETLARETLENLKTVYGDRFVLHTLGNLHGYWSAQGLARILENLCSNAVKYGCPKSPIQVSADHRDHEIHLSVQNVGEPLKSSDKTRLFELFQRAPSAIASGKKGWGIGLTIVKALAESHGGRVDVKSVDGGTVFVVTLPEDSRRFQPSSSVKRTVVC
jgi:signal transduction histidine kinase